jgi:hypothetical protein
MCVSWYLVVEMSFKVLMFPFQRVLYVYYLDMCDKDGRSLIGHIGRNINYANDLESNYNRLIKETNMLYARRDDIVVEANEHKTKEVTKKCEYWIFKVKKIEEEVRELEAKC